ncbi:LysR family transcriptional regulator [Thalassotalea euphylliae]|uniref:LysR family transcriptional regulator n=1 Tax=Thalassotalea euphylliae TaxID=1655234 RepID=A0A3E0TR39_9GAMM|nr:LysR family transcriptional regulator [Thalassotalea euphylliae]REL26974.1 LysR family transcriptional regulator [Thalassotalea euphylliae]
MDTLTGMETFIAVAKQKSFTGGAKMLGISTKLASKYVAQLESKLGAQLLNRTTRSVTVTELGRVYFDRCVAILDQYNELEGVIQSKQQELAGPIRIAAPTSFGSNELVKALDLFKKNHPRVSIDLQLSDKRVSLVEDGFDLAIRFGELEDSTLVARKLLNMSVVVISSPEYLSRMGVPKHPDALSTHDCLIFSSSVDPMHWKFKQGRTIFAVPITGSFRSNSPEAIVNMVLSGVGIGRVPSYLVKDYIERGDVNILFEDLQTDDFALNAIYPPNRHLTSRIRSIIDHLVDYFKD